MMGSGSSGGDLRTPQFDGAYYDFWAVNMETILMAHDLWDVAEVKVQPQPILERKKALEVALEVKEVRLSKFQWKHPPSPEKTESKTPRHLVSFKEL
ncbi:hypothetical protein L3X38_037406 [Prunus dulcis]|uniref:DUF4219 domain-containing protein n=1 Tax=Prunus dulcis TaxID=3755 RepID=A0AAD4V3B7_PRUDU|nr:hypothetical protein L3X38_037406 [Prunus dulcis]